MTLSQGPNLPVWLQPIADAVNTLAPEELSPRFPHPPHDARAAGVLMVFADGTDGPELLLTQRTSTLRSHAGQISFPGGQTRPNGSRRHVTQPCVNRTKKWA
jgi:hypothetical protein